MNQMPYKFGEDFDFQVSQSELINALGKFDQAPG